MSLTTGHKPSPCFFGRADKALNLCNRVLIDQWTDFCAFDATASDFQFCDSLKHFFCKRIHDLRMDENTIGANTGLSGIAKL